MLLWLSFMLYLVHCTELNAIYDYIVVGSGTGGVVASRLAEAKNKVLLIEAGHDDLTYSCKYNDTCIASPFGNLIAGTPLIPLKTGWWLSGVQDFKWTDAVSMQTNWNYNKTSLNFSLDLLRAKMLGGCLSHNGMVWTRGSVRDFDYISQKYNLSNWSFQNVLPYFQNAERYFGENKTLRGENGPIHIIKRNISKWQYQSNALLKATMLSGVPYNNHQNGDYPQTGIGLLEYNIAKYENNTFGLFNTTHYRSSAAQSYVRDIGLKSGYLTVWYHTTVQRVLFDNKLAVGVEYYDGNTLRSIYCRKEIILSAGVYQSPQILMLSGIGPIAELNKFNITPIQINNNIGRYGQNHPLIAYNAHLNMSYLDNQTLSFQRSANHTIWNSLLNKTEYLDIPGGFVIFLSSGKYDRLGTDYNDIRLLQYMVPELNDTLVIIVDPQIYSKNLTVKLKSLDSRIYPDVYPNLYADSRDYSQMMEGLIALRKILYGDDNIFIDDAFWMNLSTVEEWREFIWKNSGAQGHAIGTVAMGSDSIYPVDSKCCLKGVANLRVVDVSIWPESTNSGTMSLAHMIGEKCVKYIIDDDKQKEERNWWDKNQTYVIVVVVAICIGLVVFGGYKCYYRNKWRSKDKPIETIPLVKSK